MKLMDQIMSFGAAWPVPNSCELPVSQDWSETSVRYVIDEEVTAICDSLVCKHFDMLVDMLPLARVPAPDFWIERLSFNENNSGGRSRLGCRVMANETGRAGEICLVAEVTDAVPIVLPQKVVFDFDGHQIAADSSESFRLPLPPQLDAQEAKIAEVFAIALHPGWGKYYDLAQHQGELAREVKAQLSASVYDGLFVLAFCVLLSSQRSFREIRVELDRLNRHRVSAGKQKLLDHVEVKASIVHQQSAYQGARQNSAAARAFPRMHLVRGHFVRKGSMLYWRRTHMRGASMGGGLLSRTVHVKA